MKYRLIDAEKDHHDVSLLARVLGVSRQGYYAWAKRGPSARARRDAELTEKIRRHHTASDEIYGAPRIHADLREIDGEKVGRKRVARLMRAAGLAGVSRRRGCRTTIADRRAAAASDYVDFYASEHHAANLGQIFRPTQAPLTPNWKHLPIGYHGRAGTVVVSGTPVTRPAGQYIVPDAASPAFGPSRRLDIEAEIGFVVGTPSALGGSVPAAAFTEHVFGVVLVNDWSARDIQAWEYTPLGPFLGKSFATSVSPWVVPVDALAAARVAPHQDPAPLPYLSDGERWGLDITMEIRLNGHLISRPPFGSTYWTADQQLAHMTCNGASLRTGDLYASGTVSGPHPDQRGSLIELTWNGADPLELPDGSRRAYLMDGDTVTISASARSADGTRLGFGEVTGTIEPNR
ncbi:fumarylacetoacetase [Microtetraspora glauca]|uniref:Fumarylacetoacetase n=1 Tax=Microtetraspora glauca TaxID=1996 RepID=A0ABV3GPI8_MICGL